MSAKFKLRVELNETNTFATLLREVTSTVLDAPSSGAAAEHAAAKPLSTVGDVQAPVISYPALLAMKAEAGREKDLLDIQMIHKLDSYR